MPDWNEHYLSREVGEQTPADVLLLNRHLLPQTGRALDYASGLAANGCWLAHRGYDVTAWDNSEIAISKINQYGSTYGLSLHAEVRDVENNPPTEQAYDIVVVGFFLHRPTLHHLTQILKPGGLLFYQTFSGEQRDGRGPSNPDFRLQPGELLHRFSDMRILYYREDQHYGDPDAGIRDQALLVAARTGS